MSHNKAPKIAAVFAGASLALGGCSTAPEATPLPASTAEATPACTGQIAELGVDKGYYYFIGKISGGDCATMQIDPTPDSPRSISLHENDGLNGGCVFGNPLRLQTNYENGDLRYGGSLLITTEAAAAALPPLAYCPVMPSTESSVLM
jgi:hypothetical protein